MSKLNLETFNEILFGALKDGVKKSEVIRKEIEVTYMLKIERMEDLVDFLNKNYDHVQILNEINNIDNSLNLLGEMYEKLIEEEGGNDE